MSKKFRQFAYALLPEKIVAKMWLKSVGIEKYYLLNNKVNVTQNVSLRYEDIDEFPIQFGHISGDFVVEHCGLKSLKGFPISVNGAISLAGNEITTLQGLPEESYSLNVSNNKLNNLP